jgi:hypothetical protein
LLAMLNCDGMKGYLLSRPVTALEAEKLLP